MKGKKIEQVEAELKKTGKSQEEIDKIKPHKVREIDEGQSKMTSHKIDHINKD